MKEVKIVVKLFLRKKKPQAWKMEYRQPLDVEKGKETDAILGASRRNHFCQEPFLTQMKSGL